METSEEKASVNLEVIVERLKNFQELFTLTLNDLRDENTREHDKIVEQTTKTNGKVKQHDKWIYGIIMSGSVLFFTGSIIVSLLGYIYFNDIKKIKDEIPSQVQASVEEVLEQYNIVVE
jgi:hypothetical protein